MVFLQFEYSCSHCSTDTNSIEPYLDLVIDPCGNVEGSLVRSMDEHVKLRLAGFIIPTHLILCVKQYMNSPLLVFPLYILKNQSTKN